MSERARSLGGGPEETRLTPEDVRRRLEGRAELIEAALRGYHALEGVLKVRRWQRALRAQAPLVAEVLEREPLLDEALERVKRRSEAEGWPESTPLLRAVRELEPLRKGLEARARERLASLVPVSGEASLAGDLARLDALVNDPVSFRLEPGETFALHFPVGSEWPQAVAFLVLVTLLATYVALILSSPVPQLLWPGIVLLLALGTASLWKLRTGDLWLTSGRVVLKPPGREPVEVSLGSIPDGGIRPSGGFAGLRVEGDRLMVLPWLGTKRARRLTLLMELYRHAELRTRAALVKTPVDVVGFQARLGDGVNWQRGQCVLTRRMLYFFPDETAESALVRAATGRVPAVRLLLSEVLEGLRWQPEADLDAYLLRAVRSARGAAWPEDIARRSRYAVAYQELRFDYGTQAITGHVASEHQDTAARILQSWR